MVVRRNVTRATSGPDAASLSGTTVTPLRKSSWYTGTPGPLSSLAMVVDRLYLVPFLIAGSSLAVNRIGIAPSVAASAGGVVRLGIYASDSDGMPSTVLLDAGTIDATTTGTQYITISETLDTGLVFLAAAAQTAAPTVRASSGTQSRMIGPTNFSSTEGDTACLVVTTGVSGAFGASPAVNSSSATAPRITLRMS